MTTLHLTLSNGQERLIEAAEGLSLMEVLRPLDVGIVGTCGGSAICGTCHVWIDEAWVDRLPPATEEETDALDLSAVHVDATSRLSCQLRVSADIEGMRLSIPHAVPLRARADSAEEATEAGAAAPDAVGVGVGEASAHVAATDLAGAGEHGRDAPAAAGPPSEKTRLRRYNWLAEYDRRAIDAIIDAGIVCQIGYVIDGMPYVTPTNHWRIDDYVYWHGSSASRMLKAQQKGIPVCFTVTHLDAIVFSRAAFNHNVQFRSVMAFGDAEICEEQVKRDALRVFTDRLAPGLWDYARPPTEQEWKASKVLRMKLDEVSAKVADGLPDEDAEDYLSDRWAGHVPLRLVQLPPVADPKLAASIPMPDFVKIFRYGK